MEKRLILAIVLSFLVLFLYQAIFIKNRPQPQPGPESLPVAPPGLEKEAAASAPELQGKKAEIPVSPIEIEEVKAQSEEEIVVETSLFRAVWSNRGASLRSWKLKKYKDENQEDLDLVSLKAKEAGLYPFYLETQDEELARKVNEGLFLPSVHELILRDGEEGELKFYFSDRKSIFCEKIFVFTGGRYDFTVQLNVGKEDRIIESRLIWGPTIGNPALAEKRQQFGGNRGAAVLAANKVYRFDERKFKGESTVVNFIDWAAYEDNYIAAIFLTPLGQGNARFVKELTETTPRFFLSVSAPQRAYLGPKEFSQLREFGFRAKKLINFGFFGGIAEILLISIRFIHKYIPNWGFSIILLTLLIKIIFFPLTYSSTKSMAKMQELQPKIKALRAKYKKARHDIAQRREMNEEMMRLYKEHGINPAGGCLPILIQIPVFWGFFRLLVVAIEFRHSPFILWIKDLSVKDPYYVTPILMGVTQFISQKMTPTSADPAQARMMLIMPVIMTVFFMNFQSGLVLYWLTNNVLQIGQQYLMNRMMGKKKRIAHGKKRRK
ncbi:MAG: membrane protein insertase YidC [Candidatus Aminicenantales bacterium]